MKTVSRAYKNSMGGQLRENSFAIVRFENIDTEAASDGEWVGNGETSWSELDTLDYRYGYEDTAVTLEWNRWELGPESNQVILSSDLHDGFVSDKVSGEDGGYSTEPVLRRQFESVHTFPGITLTFDTRAEEWPTDITAVFSLDGEEIKRITKNVTSNVLALETNVEEADEIELIFHTALPYHRVRLENILFGISREYTDTDLVSITQSNDVDPLSRRLPQERFSFTILDYKHLYDPDNPEGIYRFVEVKSPVYVKYGYRLPDGTTEWLKGDNYLLDAQPEVANNQATFSATGLIGSLTDVFYKSRIGEKNFYDMAEEVLLDANLALTASGGHPWVIDETLKEMYTTAVLPIDTHMNCLQLIAHACRCVLYTDDDNVIHIEPFGVTVTGIFSGTFSDNGHTSYSEWESVNTGNTINQTYVTLEWNRWELGPDSQQIILPDEALPTGYVSSQISNSNGTFAIGYTDDSFTIDENGHLILTSADDTENFYLDENGHLIYTGDSDAVLRIGEDGHLYEENVTSDEPTFTRTFDIQKDLPVVGLQFDRILDEHPLQIEVKYYRGDVLLDTQSALIDETDYLVLSDAVQDCSKIEVTCKKTLPYYRFRVSKVYYRQTDFSLTFDNIHIGTQKISKIDKLKNVSVTKSIYTPNENVSKLYEVTTDEEALHIEFYSIVENLNVTLSDGTVESVSAYGRAIDLAVSPGLKTITITGNVITESASVKNYSVSYSGETDVEENPLITTDDMRDQLAEHVSAYLQMRNTYDVEYRGNPELETRDIIGYQTAYTDEFYALVLTDEITYNGALHGKVKVKGLITEAETVIRITAVVRPAGGGVVSGGGRYEPGDLVTLTATAADGYLFSYWLENGKNLGSSNVLQFPAMESRRIVAVFVGVQNYTIILVSVPENGGTVSGGGTYTADEEITVRAAPLSGYTFRGWMEDGVLVSGDTNYTFQVSRDRTISAIFTALYIVTVAAVPDGAGTVSGGGEYESGQTATVTASAGSKYNFVGWEIGSTIVSTSSRYSFAVTGDVVLTAVFEEKPQEIIYYGQAAALNVARTNLASANIGGYALFAGGNTGSVNSAVVESYNANLTKVTRTNLSEARQMLAGTSVGNYALFGGGAIGGGSSVVDAYNISLTRSTPTALSAARGRLSAANVGNYALFAGGYTSSIFSTVNAYNTNLTRTTPTALSTARYDMASGSIGNYALFAGGWQSGGASSVVNAYDTALTRTTPTALSTAKFSPDAAKAGDYLLIAGGASGTSGESGRVLSSVNAYNETLTRTSPVSLSTARCELAGAELGTRALFVGGYTGSASTSIPSGAADSYDANLTKKTPDELATPRYGHASATVGDYALYAGGTAASGITGSVEAYTLQTI